MEDSLNRIIIYSFTIFESKNIFFGLISKKIKYKYILEYRIDEDRFWFYYQKNNKNIEDHHTKKNLEESVRMMEDIYWRIDQINHIHEFDIYDLRIINPEKYHKIKNISKDLSGNTSIRKGHPKGTFFIENEL